MMKHVFRVEVEVVPMPGTQLPTDCGGGFVNVYIGADDIRTAIDKVEKQLLDDRYKPIWTSAAFALDLDETDYDTDEEGYPGNNDLVQLRETGEIWYGPFNLYPRKTRKLMRNEGTANKNIDSYVSNRAASRHGLKRRSC